MDRHGHDDSHRYKAAVLANRGSSTSGPWVVRNPRNNKAPLDGALSVMGQRAGCAETSLQVLHLLAELFDDHLHLDGMQGLRRRGGFGGQGVGFAIHFLEQKVETATDLSSALELMIKLLDMGAQAIQFLADVAALRQQHQLLLQALAIGLGHGAEQQAAQALILLRQPLRQELRQGADLCAQRLQAFFQEGDQGESFALARLKKKLHGLFRQRQGGIFRLGRLRLAQDTGMPEDVESLHGGGMAGHIVDFAGQVDELRRQFAIEVQACRQILLEVQVEFDLATVQVLPEQVAQGRLESAQTVGQAQLQLEMAMVDSPQLAAEHALWQRHILTGESGHAVDHGASSGSLSRQYGIAAKRQEPYISYNAALLEEIKSMRPSGRSLDQLREVRLTRHYTRHAEGSVLVEFGDTRVLCTASVDNSVPRFLRGTGSGWITAEYGMLPRSTHTRSDREAARGKQSGRTQEIQRLIGRSLRAAVDLKRLGENTLHIDCDVIQADGGTRTAAITGACVALADALAVMLERKQIKQDPLQALVAAVSVGIVDGEPVLDLDYAEDSQCDTDMNVVMTQHGGFIEIQGTAEGKPYQRSEVDRLLALAEGGIAQLVEKQKQALAW